MQLAGWGLAAGGKVCARRLSPAHRRDRRGGGCWSSGAAALASAGQAGRWWRQCDPCVSTAGREHGQLLSPLGELGRLLSPHDTCRSVCLTTGGSFNDLMTTGVLICVCEDGGPALGGYRGGALVTDRGGCWRFRRGRAVRVRASTAFASGGGGHAAGGCTDSWSLLAIGVGVTMVGTSL